MKNNILNENDDFRTWHKEFLSLPEAAEYIGVSKSTIYKLTHKKKIRYYKPNGKLIYFEKQDLTDFILSKFEKSCDEIFDTFIKNKEVNGGK